MIYAMLIGYYEGGGAVYVEAEASHHEYKKFTLYFKIRTVRVVFSDGCR